MAEEPSGKLTLIDTLKNESQRIFSPDNVVFSGGFGLAVLATAAQIARTGYKVGLQMLKRNFLVTLEVTSKDRAYPWVLQWLALRGTRTQHLSVETTMRATNGQQTGIHFDLVPGPGQHLLHYRSTFFLVQRIREQQMVDLNSGKPWEKVLFTTIGRNTKVFDRLLQDAYELSSTHEEGKTLIYTNWGSEWRQFGQPRRKRPIESVILDENIAENLVADVSEWIVSSKWYTDRGIPYRRGYLLHGPPGSGKSSFIFALAGKLNYNICILNLSERGLTDERLGLALSCVPPQSIVLLEDIDAAFSNREEESEAFSHHSSSNVTFSGLLNVLDGVAASEERLVFMTTNHMDRLDRALIRPGRIDYVQFVGDASDYQIKRLFKTFYDNVHEDEIHQFLQAIRKIIPNVSMAALQGYLLRHKGNPKEAISQVASLYQDISSRVIESALKDTSSTTNLRRGKEIKPRPVKPLTVEQVDKMYFNPQEGWDKDL